MKDGLFLIGLILLLTSCKDQKGLIIIDEYKDIRLIHTDDRYGEWGGNTFVIRIYKKTNSDHYLADYAEFEGSTKAVPPPKEGDHYSPWYIYKLIIDQKNEILLDDEQVNLVQSALSELTEIKLLSTNRVVQGGIINEVFLDDSTFFIKENPPSKWNGFQTLRRSLADE